MLLDSGRLRSDMRIAAKGDINSWARRIIGASLGNLPLADASLGVAWPMRRTRRPIRGRSSVSAHPRGRFNRRPSVQGGQSHSPVAKACASLRSLQDSQVPFSSARRSVVDKFLRSPMPSKYHRTARAPATMRSCSKYDLNGPRTESGISPATFSQVTIPALAAAGIGGFGESNASAKRFIGAQNSSR